MRNWKKVVFLAAYIAAGAPVSLTAQASTVQVLLAVMNTPLANGAKAVLIRSARATQADLIVVSPAPDAALALGSALATLQKLRVTEPTASRTQSIVFQGALEGKRRNPAYRIALEASVRRATQGTVRQIGNFGLGSVVVLQSAKIRP
jgi:hypothetical protein